MNERNENYQLCVVLLKASVFLSVRLQTILSHRANNEACGNSRPNSVTVETQDRARGLGIMFAQTAPTFGLLDLLLIPIINDLPSLVNLCTNTYLNHS